MARVAFLILLTISGGPTADALFADGMNRLGLVAMDFSGAPRIGRARTQILRAGANNPQRRTTDGSTKKGVSRKAMLHSRGDKAIRGGPRPMHGNLRFGSTSGSGSAEAKAALLSQSVSEGTKNTYATVFIRWAVWRKARKQTLMLDPSLPGLWEDELCAFYAHVGWNMGYSWSYCQSMLYSIRRAHRLVRTNLDIRDDMLPLLSMLRKGLKRIYGSPKRKIAVTVKLLLTILLLGWLDLDTWDGLLTWTALIVGFYFLLRSSEFLRKSADPAQKCLRVRNFMFPTNGGDGDCDEDLDCDEVLILHEFSKNGFLGQGTDNNIKRCKHEVRLCIPSAFNRLRIMKPAHFREKNENAFMFTLDSRLVIHKGAICRLLRNGALALGLDPRVVSTHSLRAGGCSAMFNADFPEHEIQRRGRWVSSCWKQYAWSSRRKAVDVADRMTGNVDGTLMAQMH